MAQLFTMSEKHPALLVIGGGNMGKAIVAGAKAAGVLSDLNRVVVVEPEDQKHGTFKGLGVGVRASIPEGMAWLRGAEEPKGHGVILLAVKPQSLAAVAGEIKPLLVEPRVVISILAGAPSQKVRAALGNAARLMRAMPNLPTSIRLGITALAPGAGSEPGDIAFAQRLFQAVGQVVRIEESMMDAFTALAGSGPAYVLYLAEAMLKAADRMGMQPDIADSVVRHTLLGSATLLAQSTESPALLRAAVTSKGGTTSAATEVLDCEKATDIIVKAILAARDRGATLAAL